MDQPFKPDRRQLLAGATLLLGASHWPVFASTDAIEPQPYFASVKRAVEQLAAMGQPIADADMARLASLFSREDAEAVIAAEALLERYTLARVTLDKGGMGAAALGGAKRHLVEQGWTAFLVRVSNPSSLTQAFEIYSGSAMPARMFPQASKFAAEQKAYLADTVRKEALIERMWLMSQIEASPVLSGNVVEYKIATIYSRDRGRKTGRLGFGAGILQDNPTWGAVSRASVANPLVTDFVSQPSRDIQLQILDDDGVGCMASLMIHDANKHIYPPQVMRLAPDLAFQPHIYRADGETVRLPDGEYHIMVRRGPEYLVQRATVRVSASDARIAVRLKRWIDPAKWGWYSGDTHLHAAGCAHYMLPTEGVAPETMIRHIRGEALSVGEVLTWAGGYSYQKQFFSGAAISPEARLEHPQLQAANNADWKPMPTPKDRESMLRYDLEISGFPSSLSGHLILMRLKELSYPGTHAVEDWPSWTLPVAKWAKAQGALVGYTHCSFGMIVGTNALPNYEIPTFNSVGTNEAIVGVTHGAVDFLAGCNGPPAAELNAWYHLLNCGYTLMMAGETDYPCIVPSVDSRPGIGRTYVKLPQRPVDDAGYSAWVDGLENGHLYWGDGRTHFLHFTVNGRESGKQPLAFVRASNVRVSATIAAMLELTPSPETVQNASEEPWHIEHARIGNSRKVAVELIVNGVAVKRQEMLADGSLQQISFKEKIDRSSWIAMRVLGSGHTYPVFVTIGNKPIRASRRSAEWLRTCVDALWNEKHSLIRDTELADAAAAYDHARQTYDRIIAESDLT
uniref:Putative carbamate hydrolase n=3 Tax=Pseudomonas TaxID=286 RepID=G0LNW8_9PSED|nr:putative carbamate hydrolase [Pseudomonas extremaustralis]CBY85383.2 putative carbamate hydrolase [Pseudomonas jinjuensis]CBY85384.1 putative carbamate hydrolase [Pseudomonas monteilii]